MKRIFLFLLFSICIAAGAQSFPPNVQALYNNTFNHDPNRGNYAITNGAQFHLSPDSGSFYLTWIPNAQTPANIPMIVTMHGSDGNVFDEFFLWHSFAAASNCGIIAIQWFMGDSVSFPNDYRQDSVIYRDIRTALGNYQYPAGKALLHGFSRGSARSYAINLYDALNSTHYFCTTISNSGSAEMMYPLYQAINSGVYGPSPFAGRHWSLYCGALDSSNLSNCASMSNTMNWLISKGATVDVFIQDPNGQHGGFHMNSYNADSIMTYYLDCYTNGLNSVPAIEHETVEVFPNPCNGYFSVMRSDEAANIPARIELFDSAGRLVQRIPLRGNRAAAGPVAKGNYMYVILSEQKILKRGKLIVN